MHHFCVVIIYITDVKWRMRQTVEEETEREREKKREFTANVDCITRTQNCGLEYLGQIRSIRGNTQGKMLNWHSKFPIP